MSDLSEPLGAMATCRRAMVSVLTAYPARHPVYREANALISDIDALGTLLTGNANYFQIPGHSGLAGKR